MTIEKSFENLRNEIQKNFPATRERSLALTKIDEGEMWLSRCGSLVPNEIGATSVVTVNPDQGVEISRK
jgi:hypothetical protein